jgi:TonB family protein
VRAALEPSPLPASDEELAAKDAQLFWRNFVKIGGAHLALLLALFVTGWFRPKTKPVEVLWLDGGAFGGGAPAAESQLEAEPEPEPEPELPAPVVPRVEAPAPAEIVEPKAIPTPATPKPSTPKPATPKPVAKTTPKPKPKVAQPATPQPAASPKPKLVASAKPSGTPAPKKAAGETAGAAKNAAEAKATSAGNGSAKTGAGGGGMSQFGWYMEMIDDRFRSRWEQPVGVGPDVITTVKLRIMQDGTIASREIVKPSGNPQMDESVLSAAQKVQQIDPLPAGLGNGEYFELNVNFKIGE